MFTCRPCPYGGRRRCCGNDGGLFSWLFYTDDCNSLISVICRNFYFGRKYLFLLALLGSIFAGMELQQVSKNPSELPENLKRKRLTGKILSARSERDVKLVTNIFTIAAYVLLGNSVLTCSSMCLYPWFIMQSLIMLGELIIFTLRLSKCNIMNISRQEIICTYFIIFNWIQALCYLRTLNSCCCCYSY